MFPPSSCSTGSDVTRSVVAVLIGLLAWAPAVPAARGAIRGRVDLGRSLPPLERRPSIGALGMPAPRVQVDRRQAVVYLESAPRGAFDGEERRLRMDQRDETFVPRLLAVTSGTTIDFPNNDRTYHNVFSLSKT